MIEKAMDVYAVKNGNCYVCMFRHLREAQNFARMEREMNNRLGLTAVVKIVHPPELAVRVFTAANGAIR